MSLRLKLREILYIKDTPHNLALSFAVGAFIGFSPFLGIHTLMGVVVCMFFRFNRFVLFAAMFMTNPWTIIPVYTFALWLGAVVTGVDLGAINVDWKAITLSTVLDDLSLVIMPYVVGTTLVSVVVAVAGYFGVKRAVSKAQAARSEGVFDASMEAD